MICFLAKTYFIWLLIVVKKKNPPDLYNYFSIDVYVFFISAYRFSRDLRVFTFVLRYQTLYQRRFRRIHLGYLNFPLCRPKLDQKFLTVHC